MDGGEDCEIINNDNWYETFDGILWKLKQLRDENIRLKEQLNEHKKKEV